jgi:hypothetical protein
LKSATIAQTTLAALAWLLTAGCATTVSITPLLSARDAGACEIRAQVRYDGKPEYLPAALEVDQTASDRMVFRYVYEAQYGLKEIPPGIMLVNPLTLFGFPTGSDNVVVTGYLDLIRDQTTLRSYAAAVAMKRTGTVFSEGESFTEMRRRGLLLVRENISQQLCKDQLAIGALLSAPSAKVDFR